MEMVKRIESEWPGWKVVRKIGSGGFGAVYEIERDIFGKTESAALKVISIPQTPEEIEEFYNEGYDEATVAKHYAEHLETFVKEYSIMIEMKGHGNIVYCDDLRYSKQENGIGWHIYIKMELLTPMLKVLDNEYNEEQVIAISKDICAALIACKNHNIVHRDIKPQNLFVSRDGIYKLGDFGIAKVSEKTTSGTKIGTPDYMPPEVYFNKPYGATADIYSLGLVLYWLMNEKKLPFLPQGKAVPKYEDKLKAKERLFSGEPIPAPVHGSTALQNIALKACSYNPEDRYQSAKEMLDDIIALELGITTEQNRTSAPEPEVKEEKKIALDETIRVSPPPEKNPKTEEKKQEQRQDQDQEQEQEQEKLPKLPKAKVKNKGPKIFALILAIALLITGGALTYLSISEDLDSANDTSSEEEEDAAYSKNLKYTKNSDGTYSVSGIGSCTDTKIIIPSEYNGAAVTQIASSAFRDCTNVTSVTIPKSVTAVGYRAFYGCTNLKDIYCEAKSQPADWYTLWKSGCEATVHWGQTIK